jgi:hypothetical protein
MSPALALRLPKSNSYDADVMFEENDGTPTMR